MDPKYNIPLFEDTTDEELAWLIANSHEVELARGDYYIRAGEQPRAFFVVLEGELQVTRVVDGREMVMGTLPRGIIGNELPLLYGTPSPGTSRAIAPSRLMTFDVRAFRAIFGNCPTVGAKILKIAAERTQSIAGLVKQQEKMAALGKLSAGLAHELNNPAAAARRSADTLRESLPALQARTLRLCALGLPEDCLEALIAFQSRAAERAASARPLSTIEQSDREEELGAWLDERGVANGWDLAGAFVAAHVTPEELRELADELPPESLDPVLAWLAEALSAAGLLDEIEQSSRRISDLVAAIKAYTYMDQGSLQEVNLHKGLESTLAVLGHKLKGVTVVREYDPQLPLIMARGGELNQIWTNLIDNAVDAMQGKGTLRLITRCENNFAMVEVADDGPGIPPAALPHIFEPFFTTKGVGSGSGLGLDISYRIARQHNGTIEVQSRPGHTRFIVRLPVGAGSAA